MQDCWKEQNGVLHFDDSYTGPIDLPVGVTNCARMFYGCNIKVGCCLNNFDTSNVTDMSEMFACCKMPDGFVLGDTFDTQNVGDASSMFEDAVLPDDFILPKTFAFKAGADITYMFKGCKNVKVDALKLSSA